MLYLTLAPVIVQYNYILLNTTLHLTRMFADYGIDSDLSCMNHRLVSQYRVRHTKLSRLWWGLDVALYLSTVVIMYL